MGGVSPLILTDHYAETHLKGCFDAACSEQALFMSVSSWVLVLMSTKFVISTAAGQALVSL
jgi:hypothetical protein